MQTQDYDEIIDKKRWRHWKSGFILLLGTAPVLCGCEYKVIRALWFAPVHDYGLSTLIGLPIIVALPLAFAALYWRSVMRVYLAGGMKRDSAELSASSIGMLCVLTYFAICELIKIAF
jgi:hypothetical protein